MIDHIDLHVRDGDGSLETICIEVLEEERTLCELRTASGSLMTTATRECRPGWTWRGATISVASGDAHVTVRRFSRP